ncbi:MAG: hypothetical protein ACHQNT_04825 [Bacteroidia bacterium]
MQPVKFPFLFLCLALSISATHLFSQGKIGIFAGAGYMYYNGDLGDKSNKVFTKPVFFHPYVCIGASHWLTGHIEGSLFLLHGKVDGADSLSLEKNNLARNLSFESPIDELSLRFELNTFHRYERSRLNTYIFTGASVFHFNPKAKLNGTWYELQPLGTEGQYITGGGYARPYKLFQLDVPLGFGIALQLSRRFRLKAEFCHHLLFTDYLDDVSTVYPDVESLLATPGGELAVALSGRQLNGKYPKANSQRGNSKFKDAFTTFGFTLVYNPGIMQCPATFKSTRIRKHRY